MELNVKSKKHGEFIVYYDEIDHGEVSRYNWVIDKKSDSRVYARASVKISKKMFKHVYMHRLIMGFPEGMMIDHKDRNGINNKRDNLRLTPIKGHKNSFNIKKPKHNTSGYKGVHFYKATGKYLAQITVSNKSIFGGYYKTALEAAYVYNELCKEYHGDFGCLNEFTKDEQSIIERLIQSGFKRQKVRRLEQRGFRGVSVALHAPKYRPYTAKVMLNKKMHSLGYFPTEKDAAIAYNEFLINNGGDLRKLNKIE